MYIIGSVIGGRVSFASTDEHDAMDGELVCRSVAVVSLEYEPHREETGLQGFRPGPTQTGLYSHKRWLEARNFGFRK